ncbi:Endo-1,4-beta-xylanase A [bioreactor metagenome]|uniref:Endo-1,4-beta-xylanase A n=1 Tax=bioreactor metagenome TaxID=1076179 RepID=A0A645FLR0_9ZZZZ
MPYKDYYGDVTIKYTGYNVDGDAFNGTIEIEVVSMPETEGSVYFKDVTKDYSWAASQIDSLYEKKVVSGIGNGNYGPSQNMSRGDFMLMIYRALDLTANTSGNFSDVPKDSYYYKAIATAKALGIAKGSNNMFMPTSSITREDAFVLVDRALRTEGTRLSVGDYDDLSQFKDRKTVSDYAVTSVATLVKAGIIKGTNSNINPKAFISRAEMAIILYRVLELE